MKKNKKSIFIIVGVLCVIFLSLGLLKNTKDAKQNDDMIYAKSLYEHKNKYIGNASNIGNLLSKLSLNRYIKEGFKLQTTTEPYGLTIKYKFSDGYNNKEDIYNNLYSNSVVIFSLIDNVGYIHYDIENNKENYSLEFTRKDINKDFDNNLKVNNIESLNNLLNDLNMNKSEKQKLDDAISLALRKEKLAEFSEITTEGHVILDKKENDKTVTVYTIISKNDFGFENKIFTTVSGIGVIPVVIKISKDINGNYIFKDIGGNHVYVEIKEAMDGAYYEKSIKKLFPKKLWKEAFECEKYTDEILTQQENQAKKYLESINIDAKVQSDYVEKKYAQIDTAISNELLQKEDLEKFPDWIGTREELVDGVRYIYEQSYKKEEGYDIITYQKKEGEKIIEEYKYKIIGSNLELLN